MMGEVMKPETENNRRHFSAMKQSMKNLAIPRALAVIGALFCVSSFAGAKPPVVRKPVVVIGAFQNESTSLDSAFMKSFRTRIEQAISATGKFEISDRTAMRELEQEMALAEMGITDGGPSDGMVRSIGYKVSGSVLMFHLSSGYSADMQVVLKITDIEKQVVSDAKGGIQEISVHYIPRSQGENVPDSILLNGLLSECAEKIAIRVVEYAYPPKIIAVGDNDVTVNIRDTQTEANALFDVYSPGEELFDPDTGESLGSNEELIGRIRIKTRMPKFSKAIPVAGTRLDKLEKGMILRAVNPSQLQAERDSKRLKTSKPRP